VVPIIVEESFVDLHKIQFQQNSHLNINNLITIHYILYILTIYNKMLILVNFLQIKEKVTKIARILSFLM
jgi:hypothetical protein